jgi:hypothetical protein
LFRVRVKWGLGQRRELKIRLDKWNVVWSGGVDGGVEKGVRESEIRLTNWKAVAILFWTVVLQVSSLFIILWPIETLLRLCPGEVLQSYRRVGIF